MSSMWHLALVRPHRGLDSSCQLAVGGEIGSTNNHVISRHTPRNGSAPIYLGAPNDCAGRSRGKRRLVNRRRGHRLACRGWGFYHPRILYLTRSRSPAESWATVWHHEYTSIALMISSKSLGTWMARLANAARRTPRLPSTSSNVFWSAL